LLSRYVTMDARCITAQLHLLYMVTAPEFKTNLSVALQNL
jgi:hypothetical protein